MRKKIVYVDMDNVLVDFRSALPHLKKKVRKRYDGHLDDVPGIFSLMDPMPGALCAFTELALLFDTYILSTSPWDNPSAWSDKLCWVRTHLGEPAYKRLILTHHKELNRGDFLIDDRTGNGADSLRGRAHPLRDGEVPRLAGGDGLPAAEGAAQEALGAALTG